MKKIERRRQFYKSLEAKSLKSRSVFNLVADDLTAVSGTPAFLIFNAILFSAWIIINLGLVPGEKPFDPFPFGLLTMIVSLEAIFLSIFVLISQNRSARISTIRDEVHMRVNLIAEEEITKVLTILADVRKKLGINKPDPELDQMLERINTNYIENAIAGQLNRASKPLFEQLKRDFPDILPGFVKERMNGNGSGEKK